MSPDSFIAACWIIWLAVWFFAALNAKKTVRHEDALSRLGNTLPILVGAILLSAHPAWLGPFQVRLLPNDVTISVAGAVLTFIGLVFAVWARFHIGRNWSGVITLKQDHVLIRSGPYALVRHPIYTGLMLGIIGSAVARRDIAAALAVAAVLYAVLRRMTIEESWMSDSFGRDYADYKARTPALIPFLL
ncbi:isoprenylcysteine carboxylmethyltransferase family protein [Rhizobium sp. P38BS-XIX]|nr:isoprenylcysteine carboxylmethyltransferase family protein [Rhizobium sp. P38BS-XIX]